ncbi:MAG: hydroxymethylpyrimidine/phosphomethylpyrimidine kinase [Chromatiales bacterium]|nr:hydroxymethylpyrimidine/phosphomethylpyrimidine kinase [Chromatiales bacterium]
MMDARLKRPLVLCVGGHDPSGGAGILADAEAVHAARAFPLTVITALTEQDTCGLAQIHPQPPEQIEAHCRRLLRDSPPSALKIGLIGGADIARMLARLIDRVATAEYARVPVVLDTVLATGAGQSVADAALLDAVREALVPRCTLVTPNLPEARALTGARAPEDCAERLLAAGAPWALITGTHDATEAVTNRLFGSNGERHAWDWPRLPGEYHGSGCTLASAIAARLAHGMTLVQAVESAQAYTWKTLEQALRTGCCQLTPNRLHDERIEHPLGDCIDEFRRRTV